MKLKELLQSDATNNLGWTTLTSIIFPLIFSITMFPKGLRTTDISNLCK